MRVKTIIGKLFGICLEWTHKKRYQAVLAAVEALIRGGRLSITELGRNLKRHTALKHAIKRIDRLVGNWHLASEHELWYEAIARAILGNTSRPVLLIDWTDLGDFAVLAATAAFSGRSLILYQEAHKKSHKGNRKVQHRFLQALRRILPSNCRPILVADAGFRSPFFQSCDCFGLDFIIRIRGRVYVKPYQNDREQRVHIDELYRDAAAQPTCLGEHVPYCSSRFAGRYRLVLGSKTKRRLTKRDRYYQRRKLQPWLLATTLENQPAKDIIDIYAKRMEVEETFRDTKNPRLGWALSFSMSSHVLRVNNLLLIAALAYLVVILVAHSAEQAAIAHYYQANSVKNRRVLSLFLLGKTILRDGVSPVALVRLRAFRKFVVTLPNHYTAYHKAYRGDPPHDLYCADCGDNFMLYGWPTVEE